jgi:import inner membrane translocase subunit TIM16
LAIAYILRFEWNSLGVKDEATPEDVAGTYNRMFTANDPQKGGSFYIQSKIFRAREALEREYGWNLEPLIPKPDPEVTQDPPQNK